MRQLLLRVPDTLHQRISARAAREGRSVNQVATEILDGAADADSGCRRDRLRARAAATGLLQHAPAPALEPADRRRALESTRGLGPVLEGILSEDRDRR